MIQLNTAIGPQPTLKVDSITFNNGETIKINNNDIVVFVGPNNAGKSQSLKDIYACIKNKSQKVVIKNISITLQNSENDENFINSYSTCSTKNERGPLYSGLNFNIYPYHLENHKLRKDLVAEFCGLFVNEIKTDDRLSVVNPPKLLSEGAPPTHPIHNIKSHPDLRIKLSDYFYKAFGQHLTPGFDSINIPLFIGAPIILDGNFEDEQLRQEEYKKRLSQLPKLDEQGDGMRSFTGVLLNLLMPNYSCFLIDEPESFLHPPQAKILGQIFQEVIPDNKQAFISTHSLDFLKGLISSCHHRVKIIRITRDRDLTQVSLLDNEILKSLWKDSLLGFSNLMDSVFHESTIVCESDSDCRFYSMMLEHIKSIEGTSMNSLFTYCGGKQRFPNVAMTLKALNVKFKIIPDLDILNDEGLFKTLFETCGGNWNDIKSKYNTIVNGVKSLDRPTLLQDQKDRLEEIFSKFEKEKIKELNKKQLDELRSVIHERKGWSLIKKSGISVLPNGEAQNAIVTLNQKMEEVGIHMIMVGELENFVRTVGGHGPKWVEKVVEQNPDLNSPIYENAKQFISGLNL